MSISRNDKCHQFTCGAEVMRKGRRQKIVQGRQGRRYAYRRRVAGTGPGAQRRRFFLGWFWTGETQKNHLAGGLSCHARWKIPRFVGKFTM